MSQAPKVDISSSEFKADPFSYYARLRAESPVCKVTLPDKSEAWLVTRYDDVVLVLKDERFSKNRFTTLSAEQLAKQPWIPKMFMPLARNMLDLDPPDHTRLRSLVQKAFAPQLVDRMEPRIRALADRLLDELVGRGRMDLIHDYALPIPTTVIAEMLGVPVKDRHKFHRWSNRIVTASSSHTGSLLAIPPVWLFMRFIRKLIRARSAQPQPDLVSSLVQVQEAGQHLSEDELLALVFLLIVAGHETTVNLIGNGMLALFEHPDQLQLLRSDPTLIRSAVEELLRFTAPVETGTERYAREDVTLGGATIRKGDVVFAVLASANRDESRFPNPDRLDVTRDPKGHLAFGLGIHFCLGASLARLEGQIAIGRLLERLPDLQLAVDPQKLRWRPGLVLRGLKALPLEFTPQRSVGSPVRQPAVA